MMFWTWLQQPMHALSLLAVVSLGLLVGLLLLTKRLRALQRQVADLQQSGAQMAQQLVALNGAAQQPPSPTPAPNLPFSRQLQQVEQQSERPAQTFRSAPEKYRYVAALAAQGMTAEQIAQALRISPAEAQQTIHLAQLSEPRV